MLVYQATALLSRSILMAPNHFGSSMTNRSARREPITAIRAPGTNSMADFPRMYANGSGGTASSADDDGRTVRRAAKGFRTPVLHVAVTGIHCRDPARIPEGTSCGRSPSRCPWRVDHRPCPVCHSATQREERPNTDRWPDVVASLSCRDRRSSRRTARRHRTTRSRKALHSRGIAIGSGPRIPW